ncbi:MAG: zinc ABC transporter substrate-binding protein [bacterium]|nr:zinc ABC transporter substrate-binding protein [bacterium]
MKTTLILAAMLVLNAASSFAKITVGASLPDFASIASYVGGDNVEAFSIARSTSDPHSVEVLPTYMVRVARADIYLKVGLGLDQWADQIIEGARNSKLKIVDCSARVSVLEKPTRKVDASMGDVHPDGNPHYWLDPANGVLIAETIADALVLVDPEHAEAYRANLERFRSETEQKMSSWKLEADKIANHSILTYHSSWSYFARAFEFNIAAKIEPVPGIPPSASHLALLVNTIRKDKVRVVIQEPYFSDDGANYLARETGVSVTKLSPSCADVSPLHISRILIRYSRHLARCSR